MAFSFLSSDRGQEAPQVKERPFPGGPHTLIPTCPSLTASDQLQDQKVLAMTLSNPATLKTLGPRELPFQSQRNRLGGLPAGRPCRGRRTGRQRLLEPPPRRNSQGHLRGAFLERGFREPAPPQSPPPALKSALPPSRRASCPYPAPPRYLRRPRRRPAGLPRAPLRRRAPPPPLGRPAGRQAGRR